MSIPESHLAQEAIAALVDGELTAGPAHRAARHLAGCLQCRMAVQAQREAKDALLESADVALPGEILLSPRTFAAVENMVTASEERELSLKGFSKPVNARSVLALAGSEVSRARP